MPIPKEWTFRTPAVARAFDSHVREQLPWYDLATGIVGHVARSYIPDDGLVIDVGASTGNIGRALKETLATRRADLVAIDSQSSMKKVYDGPGIFEIADAVSFDFTSFQDPRRGRTRNPDVIVCFLSLMFVPVVDRSVLIKKMHSALNLGGALIVFDKTAPRGGYIGSVMYRLALAAKYENGAKPDEIIAKELSLSGVQRPLGEDELAGFVEVFRFGDFAGFVLERS